MRALLSVCRREGIPVLFTRHGHRDPKRDGGMLGEWWGDLIEHGTRACQLLPELERGAFEPVIDKDRYSAFHGTQLRARLNRLGVNELIICGVMTNCCCETTARDAFVRDFRVFSCADATATSDEELHLATLKNLAFGFAHIVSSAELSKGI